MTPAEVPRVTTPRLVLRGWREDDVDAYAAAAADPEVMRHLGGVLDRAEAWRQVGLHAGHWVLRGYGNWAVERREDGVLVGRAGLWNPDGWPGLEVGWMLARHAWGRGYATEAGRAAMAWAWATLAAPRLIALIAPGNAASARVAERLDMRPAGEDTIAGQAVRVFAAEQPAR